MTLDDFIAIHNGQGIDFDGAFGDQCVDLVNQYNKDVVGGPILHGNAIDYFNNFPGQFYDKFAYAPGSSPAKGDIVVWGQGVGPFGHVAVYVSPIAQGFTSFDQNWPIGSLCHLQPHNFGSVLGWLRPKGQPPGTVPIGPTFAQAALAAAPPTRWMVVSHDFALWKYASAHQLQDQQTPEIPFVFAGAQYRMQVFLNGIVYCAQGDWGHIQSVPKPAPGAIYPPLVQAAIAAAPPSTWMPVSHDFALWKFASSRQLQDQQTAEISFMYKNDYCLVQVFLKGIVYCKVNDWGNIQMVPK